MQRRTKAWLTSYRWKVPRRSQPPTVAATPPTPAAAVPVHAVHQEPMLGPSADGCVTALCPYIGFDCGQREGAGVLGPFNCWAFLWPHHREAPPQREQAPPAQRNAQTKGEILPAFLY